MPRWRAPSSAAWRSRPSPRWCSCQPCIGCCAAAPGPSKVGAHDATGLPAGYRAGQYGRHGRSDTARHRSTRAGPCGRRGGRAVDRIRRDQCRALEFARTAHERWQNSPKGVGSEQEREDKKSGFESAKAKVSAALSQVNLAEAEVERLAADEQFKQVRAPFTGTIVQRRIDIGNLVTAGSTSGNTPLYRMTRNDPIRVFVDAPQPAAETMKVGTPARIHVNARPKPPFAAAPTRTRPS